MRIVFGILLCVSAWGASISSNGTGGGLWSSGSSWVGGVAPSGSDTPTIVAGDTITYDSALTHTAPITVNGALRGTGTITLILSNTTLTVAAGGAITNTGGVFTIQAGAQHATTAKVNLNGSSGSHVSVTGESAANYIVFTNGGFISGGQMHSTYTDFAKVGTSASVAAFTPWLNGAIEFSLQNCTMDSNSGMLSVAVSLNADAIYRIEDCKLFSTAQNMTTSLSGGNIGAGVRSIQRNYFAGSLGTSAGGGQWWGVTFDHNVIRGGMFSVNSADLPWAAFTKNIVQQTSASSAMVQCGATSESNPNYYHIHSNSGTLNNIRGFTTCANNNSRIAGWIIEPGDTDGSGDIIVAGDAGIARTWIVERNLLMYNKNGSHSGQFISMLGSANTTFRAQHNTYFVDTNGGENGAISYGEIYAGFAGMIDFIRSNLVVGNGNGAVFSRRNLGTVSDGATAAAITNNGKYQLTGTGYPDYASVVVQPMFSTGTPGANDVTGNPSFVDSSRRLSSWAVARGYSVSGTYNGQCDDAYTALQTNTASRLDDLLTYVAGGFAPTNSAFRNAGHDGATIGAFEGVFRSGNALFFSIP